MLDIIEINEDFLVINKPPAMPSQPDLSGDLDAMSAASLELRGMGEADELWLVHRLDRVVGGLLVFARNKRASARISEALSASDAVRGYLAVLEGCATGGELVDLLYKDAARGKAVVTDRKIRGAKEARLEYKTLAVCDCGTGIRSLVNVRLITGRFHQIRAQFSSRSLAIVGDGKYGAKDRRSVAPALYAYRISFTLEGKRYDFSRLPDTESYPWSLFDFSSQEILK